MPLPLPGVKSKFGLRSNSIGHLLAKAQIIPSDSLVFAALLF